MSSELESEVERIVAPTLEAMGYDVVRIRFMPGSRPTLQIMTERHDHAGMTVDDCAGISRAVSALLDVEDPIHRAYHLEISSPGVDRPLVRRGDFERFAGHEAKIETRRPIDGRKRFRGRVIGVAEDVVRIGGDDWQAGIELENIAAAKLVPGSELGAATDKKRRV